jgi:hypothetical protein
VNDLSDPDCRSGIIPLKPSSDPALQRTRQQAMYTWLSFRRSGEYTCMDESDGTIVTHAKQGEKIIHHSLNTQTLAC